MVDIEPPGGERAEIGRQTEEGQQAIGLDMARVAREIGQDNGRELPGIAFERVQLIRNGEIDPAFLGKLLQLGRGLRRGAKLAAAVHDRDALGDLGQ